MTSKSIRAWFLVHKWTSLVCTAFLLMLCVTGLPLIFHDEIDHLTEEAPRYGMPGVGSSGETPGLLSLDVMLTKALAAWPGEVPVFMAFDNDQPLMTITTAPRPDSPDRASRSAIPPRLARVHIPSLNHTTRRPSTHSQRALRKTNLAPRPGQ